MTEHIHAPVQHRDNKPPWCKECGLTADYEVPKSRIETLREEREARQAQQHAQMIPARLSTEDLAKKWFDEDEKQAQDYIGFAFTPRDWETAHPELKEKYRQRVQEARR